MKTIITIAALLAAVLVAAPARADGPDYTLKDRTMADPNSAPTGGYKIGTAAAGVRFDTTVWTGWMYVEQLSTVCFTINYERVAATGVTMRCETADSKLANDAGFDVHEQDIASGVASSYPITWKYTSSASAKWPWCVSFIPAKYLNCAFDDLASGGATDLIRVFAIGVAP